MPAYLVPMVSMGTQTDVAVIEGGMHSHGDHGNEGNEGYGRHCQ